jgi:hypothetical protein
MKTQKKNASHKKQVEIRLEANALRNLRRAERVVSECASAWAEVTDNAPTRR